MEKSFHRFSELFSQLGLRMDAAGIGEFLEAHAPLPADVLLADAPFWTPSWHLWRGQRVPLFDDYF